MTADTTPAFSRPLPEGVRAGLVAALYQQAVPGFVVTLAVAAVCTAMLWTAVERAALGGWFALVVLITAARYLLVRKYRAGDETAHPKAPQSRFPASERRLRGFFLSGANSLQHALP